MFLGHAVVRFMLKAKSALGLAGSRHASAAGQDQRTEQERCPFVLVACVADSRWGVFQLDFDKPLVVFDGLQEACNYAKELARARTGAMVLIGKRRNSAAGPAISAARQAI